MIRSVRFEAEAGAQLDDILDWTFANFGPRQAERYRAKLHAAFDRLADGTLRGRSAAREWGEGVRDGLLFARVEKHVVLFIEEPEEVVVVELLHEAMDLAARVRG